MEWCDDGIQAAALTFQNIKLSFMSSLSISVQWDPQEERHVI
jgi:hypothetical protein